MIASDCNRKSARSTAFRLSCSRCRISPWKTACRARNISSPLRTPAPPELATLNRRSWSKNLKRFPSLTDVASDQQLNGLEAELVIDRDTASRLGITPQNIDDTLDDAFGQRQVSTIFTQLNQYHVVMEVAPNFQRNVTSARQYLRQEFEWHAGAAQPRSRTSSRRLTETCHQPSGPVSFYYHQLQSGSGPAPSAKR